MWNQTLPTDVRYVWTNASEDQVLQNYSTTYAAISCVMWTSCATGVVINSAVIFMFRRCRKLHSSTNLLVEALAWMDLLMCAFGNPVVAVGAMSGHSILNHYGTIAYGLFMTYLGLASIHILTGIAIDRYICVVVPHLKARMSSRTTNKLLVLYLALPLIWSLAPLCGWNYFAKEGLGLSASVNWVARTPAEAAYTILLLLVCFFLPVTIIAFSYIRILQAIRTVSQQASWGPDHYITRKNQRLEAKMAKTSFCVISAFLLTWLPYSVVSLMTVFRGEIAVSPLVATVPAVFAKCSGTINPIIYVVTNTQFRIAFWELLRGTRTSKARHSARQSDSNTDVNPVELDCPQPPVIDLKDVTQKKRPSWKQKMAVKLIPSKPTNGTSDPNLDRCSEIPLVNSGVPESFTDSPEAENIDIATGPPGQRSLHDGCDGHYA